jgi:hypothetical protein
MRNAGFGNGELLYERIPACTDSERSHDMAKVDKGERAYPSPDPSLEMTTVYGSCFVFLAKRSIHGFFFCQTHANLAKG